MTWLKLIALAFNLVSTLATIMRERSLRKSGAAEAIAEGLKESHARIEKARAARRGAAAGGMRDDDPYRRD